MKADQKAAIWAQIAGGLCASGQFEKSKTKGPKELASMVDEIFSELELRYTEWEKSDPEKFSYAYKK
ncbi:MAG: hypothetical protein WCT14_15060 [Treponemataceae bacterium]